VDKFVCPLTSDQLLIFFIFEALSILCSVARRSHWYLGISKKSSQSKSPDIV